MESDHPPELLRYLAELQASQPEKFTQLEAVILPIIRRLVELLEVEPTQDLAALTREALKSATNAQDSIAKILFELSMNYGSRPDQKN
jgi:hypothetical protein